MKKLKRILALVLALALVFALAACGDKQEDTKPSPSDNTVDNTATPDNNTPDTNSDQGGNSGEKRKIIVGTGIGGAPYEYINDDGEPDGYDVKVMMEVEKLLPQYEFEYAPTTIEDIMTSLSANKMQIGLSNCFKTPEREEKYIFPENPIGACLVGLVVRTEDAECDTIEKCVKKGLVMCPVAPTDGFRVIVDEYNAEHPDAQIEMATIDITSLADFYIYVAEGRYDYLLMSSGIYDSLIKDENGDLHAELSDKLVQHEITAVETWPLFAPGEEQLAKDVSDALKQLRDDGTLSKLQEEYIGIDQFQYLGK